MDVQEKDHSVAIAELRTRRSAEAVAIVKLDALVSRHDDIIKVLTESLATKDDIADLRNDLRERLDRDELLDERLDHQRQRMKELEEAQKEKSAAREHSFNRRMSWAMAAMFLWECVLTWIGTHHGK